MAKTKNMEQIQVRIDTETKEEARKVLDNLGLDISTAVKMMLRQVINTGNLPYEIRDNNGFTIRDARELRRAAVDARSSAKTFKSGKAVIKDALK